MTISNLYAEKVYSANPSILWSLDDTLSGTPVNISSFINTAGYGIPAYAYGRPDNYGYYLSSDNTLGNLKLSNDGIPMVFGATTVTTIYENKQSSVNYPSLILPGYGFMNDSGKYSSYTVEMWLKINSNSDSPYKIFGPISGNDGLYVNGPFLSLRIGDNVGSHYIAEWNRPMIIHITYNQFNSGVMINGEQVISLNYNVDSLNLVSIESDSNKDQNWLGFYAYENVTPIQIDCVAIYPYVISNSDAKLHFVWGQAVESPEQKNSGYSDVPIVIDYQMSKAANSYNYPGTGRWQNGIYNNLSVQNNKISAPLYNLPTIVFEDPALDVRDWSIKQGQMLEENSVSDTSIFGTNTYFKMEPNPAENEWNANGYIDFESFNQLSENVEAFYGVFQLDSFTGLTEQLLFKISNEEKQTFEATIDSSGAVTYTLKQYDAGTSSTDIESFSGSSITEGQKFVAGFNINDLSANATSQKVSAFFNNRSSLKLIVAGNNTFEKMFSGKIYKIGFCGSQNFSKISTYFETSGIAKQSSTSNFNSHIASYTLFGVNTFSTFSLDIAVNSTWQDYVPLRLLAKNTVVDDVGTISYSLNFLQFNIDYPEITLSDYSVAKIYAAFDDLTLTIPQNIGSRDTVSLSSSKVVTPGVDWKTEKYSVQTDTIIYPPDQEIDDLAITIFIDFYIPGIFRNPLEIRSLNISSQSIEYKTQKTPIGTRYGKDIYPYVVVDGKKDYGVDNPFSIYKNSTPYLYLNNYSGIRLAGSTFDGTRGIEVPINASAAPFYEVGLIQASILYRDNDVATDPVEIYRITGTKTDSYIVYAKNVDANNAYIYVTKNGTVMLNAEVSIFVNGVQVTDADDAVTHTPVLIKNEWAMIGIGFTDPLVFSSSSGGAIEITGPFLINNISDYQIKQIDKQRLVFNYLWSDWSTGNWSDVVTDNWSDLLLQPSSTSVVNLDGEAIYRSYVGNNRLTIDESNTPLRFSKYNYALFSDIAITTQVITPL